MIVEILGSLITSVVGGGATGLLGLLLQRWFDARKQANDLEILKVQQAGAERLRQMDLEHEAKNSERLAQVELFRARVDAQARADEAAARSQEASFGHDRPTYSLVMQPDDATGWGRFCRSAVALGLGLVDIVRGIMRPGITTYTLVLLTWVLWWVQSMYQRAGVVITAAEVKDLATQCVGTIFYLSTTCTVWWFGTRPGQPKPAG